MCAEGAPLSLKDLQLLHSLKTGALITASLLAGATIGNASREEYALMKLFGDELGLAFQIFDDILDVTHAFAKRGAQQSSDEANNKTTYVTLLGIEEAARAGQTHRDKALEHLKALKRETGFLEHLATGVGKGHCPS